MEIKSLVEKSITMEFMSMIVYQDLANKILDDSARNILRYLAKGEEGHIAKLVEMFTSFSDESVKAMWEVDIIQSHRKEALLKLAKSLEKWGINRDSPAEDILNFAREAERFAYNYYMDLADKSSDEEIAGVFKELANEEKDHEINVIRLKEMLK